MADDDVISSNVFHFKVEMVVNPGKGQSFNFLTYSLRTPSLLLNVHAAGNGPQVKVGDLISSMDLRDRSGKEPAVREATPAEIKKLKGGGNYTGPVRVDISLL